MKFQIEVKSQGQWIPVPATPGYNEFETEEEARESIPQLAEDMEMSPDNFTVTQIDGNMDIVQIDTDWQEGISAEPLQGEEEEQARNYINAKLREWEIQEGDENTNDYIMRAWEEWTSLPSSC